jgi:hypothetical protein
MVGRATSYIDLELVKTLFPSVQKRYLPSNNAAGFTKTGADSTGMLL